MEEIAYDYRSISKWNYPSSIYCLAALGFNMIFGVLKMLNFAHGEILMFGTFVFLL